MILQGNAPVREIIIHCTATRPEWWAGKTTAQKVAEIRRWHVQDRGWKDIGYHWLIDRDGKVAKGRPMTVVGAHVAGRNTGTIGISLFGGHGSAETDKFSDNFTPAQDAALRKLIAEIKTQTQIVRISGHNEYAAKACPGFTVKDWLSGAAARSKPSAAPATPTSPSAARKTGPAAFIAAIIAFFTRKR